MTRQVLYNTTRPFKIYMVEDADNKTPVTGLVGSFTVTLSKSGSAEASVAPSIVERGNGWYEVTPLAAHRDTLGESAWTFSGGTAAAFPRLEEVVAYDSQAATGLGLSQLALIEAMRGTDGANTVTPPTSAAIATVVRGNLAVELGRIDENVSAAKVLSAAYDNAKTAATQTSVDALQISIDSLTVGVATRCRIATAAAYEHPESGSVQYSIQILTVDSAGVLLDADATPTLTISNVAGTDRSANLSAITHPSTGRYAATYTVTNGDTLEPLVATATAVIDGQSHVAVALPVVTDAVAVDFTATDRNNMLAILADTGTMIPNQVSSEHTATQLAVDTMLNAASGEIVNLVNTNTTTGQNTLFDAIMAVGNLVDAIKSITDKLDTGLEDNGVGGYQWTSLALENSPAGGGDGTVSGFDIAALKQLFTVNANETPVSGSVVHASQGAAGGDVSVDSFTANALQQLSAIKIVLMSLLDQKTSTLILVQTRTTRQHRQSVRCGSGSLSLVSLPVIRCDWVGRSPAVRPGKHQEWSLMRLERCTVKFR